VPCKTSVFCFIAPAILVSNRKDGTLPFGKQQVNLSIVGKVRMLTSDQG
jgi:hypothetical protein